MWAPWSVQDPAAGERALRAPLRRPVGIARVGRGAHDLVLDEVEVAESREHPADRLPGRRVVVLMARPERDPRVAHRGRDALGVRHGGGERLLADRVNVKGRGADDQLTVRVRGRADVAEVERLTREQLLGVS